MNAANSPPPPPPPPQSPEDYVDMMFGNPPWMEDD